jgi:Ca-activated chloride channel family protein
VRLDWPIGLLALLLVPLALAGWWLLERRQARYAVRYTNLDLLATVVGPSRWRAWIPVALVLLALTSAAAALARPEARLSASSDEASIALVVDESGSMAARDVKPTRLAAAEGAIRRFLDVLPKRYRVGLVIFSSEPYVASPLTQDRKLLLQSLAVGVAPGQGTAIGDALARAVDLLEPITAGGPVAPADRPLSAILMLSDGAQTSGLLAPLQGAARAKSFHIPVYTVALGTPGGVLHLLGFSRPVPPDPTTLRAIAQATGGQFFATQSQARLNTVYESLASKLGKKKAFREITDWFVAVAALFALAAGALSLLWSERLP